jgi:GAF domain-containing protein
MQPRNELSNISNPMASRCDAIVSEALEQVKHMLMAQTPRDVILARLASAAEEVAGHDSTVSILVLDQDGLLRDGASPNLPCDYLNAISGLKPDPQVGTCAAAAATGAVVLTPDFCADDKWAELRHLPLALGYVGAWSVPIKSADGKVLGTFGTYFRSRRTPTPEERNCVEQLAEAAAETLTAK